MKLFTTKVHGLMDYLSAASFLLLPGALGLSRPLQRVLRGVALAKLVYSPLTKYELGLLKVLPVKGHLALDALLGIFFGMLPFLYRREPAPVRAGLLGLLEQLVVLTTETRPYPAESVTTTPLLGADEPGEPLEVERLERVVSG